jgi:hypothetical protein
LQGPSRAYIAGQLDKIDPVCAVYIERMSEVKITALENGPLEVDGACAARDLF